MSSLGGTLNDMFCDGIMYAEVPSHQKTTSSLLFSRKDLLKCGIDIEDIKSICITTRISNSDLCCDLDDLLIKIR